MAGFTSNPMQEPAASTIPEFTTAATPGTGRLRPGARCGVGRGHRRLRRPGRARAPGVRGQQPFHAADRRAAESPALAADIAAFWTAYHADQGPGISAALRAAAARLTAAWQQIASAPGRIERLIPHPEFTAEAGSWLAKFQAYGLAGQAAVRYLLAVKAGASTGGALAAADRYYAQASGLPEVVGEGVFENFLLAAVPALFTYDVRLYAADPADDQAALAAARAAGLPADQVTQSFSTAWDQTSSGEYLVIAVGGPADDALYYNVCGWTAPDGLGAGFDAVRLRGRAGDALPPMNIYENGADQTAATRPR